MGKSKGIVFITGAGGFIGANLTRKLVQLNYSVHILNRKKNLSWRLKEIENQVIIHYGDLTNFKTLQSALKKIQPDYIIHLAAYGAYSFQTEIEKIISVNILGTKNLLEASKNIPYKCFINTGSSSEYGFKDKPMKEDDFCDPVSYYAITKLTATHMCKIFSGDFNKPIVTLRPFSVYGPYEEPARFIPTIMKALILGKAINLTPGNQRRDFIYIDDVLDAYLKALKLGKKIKGKTFNIGFGKEFTNQEVVKKIFEVSGNKTKIKLGSYPKRYWDTEHWQADISYAKKNLKWAPKYNLGRGLKMTHSWFEKNLNFYN